MRFQLNYDITDLIFRLLFSLVFLALGFEHLISDELIQSMMPLWFPFKRLLSVFSGVILLLGGFSIMLGYRTHQGALLLAVFLLLVTILIHGPALFVQPAELSQDCHWLWDLYQRSNFIKNLCLLGGCVHLINHQPGRFSLDDRPAGASRK